MGCSRCGYENPEGSRFCTACGHPLEAEATASFDSLEAKNDQEPLPPQADLSPGEAQLVVTRGENAGSRFRIPEGVRSTTLGRSPSSDVFLDDLAVSRRHAEISRSKDGFYLHDLGSLNGTYLNRERIEESKLAHGDELQIGRFKLTFLVGPPR